jgi:hypothetical protein
MLATSTIRSTSDPTIKLSYPRDRTTIDVDGYPEWSLQGTTTYDLGTFTLNSTGAPAEEGADSYNQGGLYGEQILTSTARTTIASGNVGITLPFTNATLFTSISYGDIGDNYAYMWIGFFKPPTTGIYTFYTSSDDGSGVWIGDIASAETGRDTSNAIVNNDLGSGHGNQERSGSISLTADLYYPIRIVHEEGTGGSNMTFSWAGPDLLKTTDLSQYFYYYSDGSDFTIIRTIPPEGVFTPAEIFGSLSITPPVSYTAPEFNLNKRIQISVKRSFIIQTLNEVRKSIESRNNLVPFNLADLRILDRTAKEYTISRAIASNVDSGGGGGATETESWF